MLIEFPEEDIHIGRQLKKALYGEVRGGIILVPSNRPEAPWQRPNPCPRDHEVAIKVIYRRHLPGGRDFSKKRADNPLNEIAAMQYIANEFERRIQDPTMNDEDRQLLERASRHVMRVRAAGSDEHRLFIVMKKVRGGELFDAIPRFSAFSRQRKKRLFSQITLGLFLLHYLGVCHRDVSLENILYEPDDVNGEDDCIVMDFGMCHRMPEADGRVLPITNIRMGKAYYIPIEHSIPGIINGYACDVWALGVVLFIVATSNAPFVGDQINRSWYNFIQQGRLGEKPVRLEGEVTTLGAAYPPSIVNVLKQLLNPDWRSRVTLRDIIRDPWFQDDNLW